MFVPYFSPVVMTRLVLQPFTFSTGVTIPPGTLVSVPANATQTDETIHENPNKFDGFRFAKLREKEGEASGRHQAISASADNLSFGLGRHAW